MKNLLFLYHTVYFRKWLNKLVQWLRLEVKEQCQNEEAIELEQETYPTDYKTNAKRIAATFKGKWLALLRRFDQE